MVRKDSMVVEREPNNVMEGLIRIIKVVTDVII